MKLIRIKKKLLSFSLVIITRPFFSNTITKDEMKTFFDREIKSAMDEYKVAGVTLSVVQDQNILYSLI